jgi:DNA-directed RNA polymerase specialized sigma24 family protein
MSHRINHDYAHVEAIAVRASQGCEAAAEELLRLTEHVVLATVRSVGDARKADREDLAQQARIAVWSAMRSYEPGATWFGYARTVVRRVVYRGAEALRAERKREVMLHPSYAAEESDALSPLERMVAHEDLRERALVERERARADVLASRGASKHDEIEARQRHGITVGPEEELPSIRVRPADRIRLALIAAMAVEHWKQAAMGERPRTEGRDFFPVRKARQGRGAPEFANRGLLGPGPVKSRG